MLLLLLWFYCSVSMAASRIQVSSRVSSLSWAEIQSSCCVATILGFSDIFAWMVRPCSRIWRSSFMWVSKQNPFTISSFIHSKRNILQVLAVTWQPRSGGKKTIQVPLLHNYWTKQIAPSAIRIQSPSLLMVEEEQQNAQLSPEKQIIIFRYTLDMLKKWQSFYMKSFTVHAAQFDANYCYSLLQDIQILRFPCVSLHRNWERCMCQNTNR